MYENSKSVILDNKNKFSSKRLHTNYLAKLIHLKLRIQYIQQTTDYSIDENTLQKSLLMQKKFSHVFFNTMAIMRKFRNMNVWGNYIFMFYHNPLLL